VSTGNRYLVDSPAKSCSRLLPVGDGHPRVSAPEQPQLCKAARSLKLVSCLPFRRGYSIQAARFPTFRSPVPNFEGILRVKILFGTIRNRTSLGRSSSSALVHFRPGGMREEGPAVSSTCNLRSTVAHQASFVHKSGYRIMRRKTPIIQSEPAPMTPMTTRKLQGRRKGEPTGRGPCC
jgi:hypothetical protein